MWRTSSLAVLLTVIACALLLVMIATNPGEPRYNGRRYTYWISMLDQTNSGADTAIQAIGTNAIPILLKLIEFGPTKSYIRNDAIRSLLGAKTTEPWNIGRKAATAFRFLGTNASPAIPVLLEGARKQPGSLTLYPRALAGIGSPVLPLIRPYSSGPDLYMQFVAIRTLAEMAEQDDLLEEADRAFPLLVTLLHNTSEESWDGRNAALDLMQRFPLQPKLAIPALIGLLEEKNDHLRGKAVATLGEYGANAADALPKLSATHKQALIHRGGEANSIQQVIQRIQMADRREESSRLLDLPSFRKNKTAK